MKPEQKIQQEIVMWFHNTYTEYIIHSIPNGVQIALPAKEMSRVLSQMYNVGMLKGVADLAIWLPNGKAVMCEVKNSTNNQQPAQKKIEAKMNAMNSNYILVRSLEDFQEQIKTFLP